MNKKLRKWFRGLTAGKAVHFLLALLWFGLTLFPLYFTVVSSLKLDNEIWDTMFQLPSIPQWENYFKAAETAGILSAIVNSVVISLGSVAIMIVCVMMSSYVIARRLIKRAKALNLYLLAALMIPLQGAIVPIVQMVGAVGGKNNFFVLMLIYVGLNISISSFILVGYIGGISREIDEAAAIDGASAWQTLRYVKLPMLMPSITICTFLTLTNGFKLFDQNLALTGGMPSNRSQLLALNIYDTFYGRAGWEGAGQAKAVVFCLIVVTIALLQLRLTRTREVQQ